MRPVTSTALAAAVLCCATAFAQKLALRDLPPAVQKTVQEQLKGGEIKSIGKEKEHGITQYEVESVLHGTRRDFEVDTKGNLLGTEEEISIDAIPAGAKDAILKKVGTGKVTLVETVTERGQTYYEATYTTMTGKKRELAVNADGTGRKLD